MGLMLWFSMGQEADWLLARGMRRALWLAMIVCGGAATYFSALFALGFRIRDFRRTEV